VPHAQVRLHIGSGLHPAERRGRVAGGADFGPERRGRPNLAAGGHRRAGRRRDLAHGPGSSLYLVWTQGRQDLEHLEGSRALSGDLDRLFRVHPANTFLIKVAH